MNEWVRTAIVYINLIATGSEAHNLHKVSQGSGNLWIFYLSTRSLQCCLVPSCCFNEISL